MTIRVTLLALLLVAYGDPSTARAQNPVCHGPAYREFDFWLGQWDVFERGSSTKTADVLVTAELDGCVIRETYEDTTGLRGVSLSSYDAQARQWQQTWTTNRGQLLVIHGQRAASGISFTGWMHETDGETQVRATWAPEGDGVRETAERSRDGGTTWTPWFDLSFRHRPPGIR